MIWVDKVAYSNFASILKRSFPAINSRNSNSFFIKIYRYYNTTIVIDIILNSWSYDAHAFVENNFMTPGSAECGIKLYRPLFLHLERLNFHQKKEQSIYPLFLLLLFSKPSIYSLTSISTPAGKSSFIKASIVLADGW